MCVTGIYMSKLTLLQELNTYKRNYADVCVVVCILPQIDPKHLKKKFEKFRSEVK